MARKRRAPNYTGALAQPIYFEDHYKFTGALGQPIPELDVAAISKEQVKKMRLLFQHYKIDPSDEQSWQKLAARLVLAHVPGLRLANRPKPGRKPTWKTVLGGLGGLGDELVHAVDDVKSQTGKRTKYAIRRLQKDKPEKWGRYTPASLGVRYREARREARARQKALAFMSEWLDRQELLDEIRPMKKPHTNQSRSA